MVGDVAANKAGTCVAMALRSSVQTYAAKASEVYFQVSSNTQLRFDTSLL